MHSDQPRTPARRPRRLFFIPLIAAGAALGVLATTGLTIGSPALAAAAPLAAAALSDRVPAAESLHDIRVDAQSSLLAARVTLSEAADLTDEIQGSRLDLGVDTSIDTTALARATHRLSHLDVVPIFLVPGVADDANTINDGLRVRITELRDDLAAAKEKKAAEVAAAAAAEAQRQAEAAAAAIAAANTPDGAKAAARQMASSQYGWGDDQFSCLESLWNKESGWNYQAYNSDGGATGIPQSLPGDKMAAFGADWQTNATTQIAWGLDYISRGYGSPCAAWGHSQSTNWY